MKNKLFLPGAIATVCFLSFACNPAEKTETLEKPETVSDVVLEEEFVVVIGEHHLDETPITSHPTAQLSTKEADETPYEVQPAIEFQKALIADYEVEAYETPQSLAVAIPLDETQTIMAFNKKGKSAGGIQIVSDSTGEVDHILFEDKNHKDVYDVQAGMSAKEVKKLRKEMKHMLKNGQVFFYTDDSNIMYLLDAEIPGSGELVEADIEESVVTAVIWKDKNHEDHPKNSK